MWWTEKPKDYPLLDGETIVPLYASPAPSSDARAVAENICAMLAEKGEWLAVSYVEAHAGLNGLKPSPTFAVNDTQRRPEDDIGLCDSHAQAWFTERDHLHGGMEQKCVVCAFVPSQPAQPPASEAGKLTAHEIELIRACLDDGTYTAQERKDIGLLCNMALRADGGNTNSKERD